eukprot:c17400_g2_i1 orf=314-2680(+)
MGCASSRIDDTEFVMGCKNRKRLVKQAMNYRRDLAISHMAYIQALRNIGIALRRFAEGDCYDVQLALNDTTRPPLLLPQAEFSSFSGLPQPEAASSLPLPLPLPLPPVSVSALATDATAILPPPSPAAVSPSSPLVSSAATEIPPLPHLELSPTVEEVSKPASSIVHSEDVFISPERSPKDSPSYSPVRERHGGFFVAFPSPPLPSSVNPPSPPRHHAWDFFDFFQPPPVLFHLQEPRRVKEEYEGGEQYELEHVKELEGIPNLEEELRGGNDESYENKQKGELLAQEKPIEHTLEGSVTIVSEDPERGPERVEETEAVVTVIKEVVLEEKINEDENKELAIFTTCGWKNFVEVARQIDDQFIRAYTCGKDIAGMLEASKVHHHPTFLESKDSVRFFNAITWHWSRKTIQILKDAGEDSDLVECGMTGSHASTLERLYAWEKKLYDEVKAGEIIRAAFDRKCQQLKSQDAKGEDPNVIDKTRAAVKSLDTQLMVALRAIHSVSLRIQKLTNEELFPQLAEILQGLINMWKIMFECHKTQKAIALEINSLENSAADEEITEAHRKATIELETELNMLQIHFNRWISSQRFYIDTLLAWLRICRMEPETDSKGRAMSPFWTEGPPIFSLIKNWHQALNRLQDKEKIVDSISDFSVVIHSLQLVQLEELQQKRTENFVKDLGRKTLHLQNMETRYLEAPHSFDENQETDMYLALTNGIEGKSAVLYNFGSRLEEEKQKFFNAVPDRREVTLRSLKSNLPNIFEAMASFAAAALQEYQMLQQILGKRKFQFV